MTELHEDSFYHPLCLVEVTSHTYVTYGRVLLIFQGPINYERRNLVKIIMEEYDSLYPMVSDITFKKHVPGRNSSKDDWGVSVTDDELDDFYTYCRRSVQEAFQESKNLIIIDQSRIDSNDLNYYVYLAQKLQYVILTYPIIPEQEGDGNEAAAGHDGKPPVAVQTELMNHLFCGWFLDHSDTKDLRVMASSILGECFEGVPGFRNMLTEYLGEKDPKSYYNLDSAARDLAFCAVKIVEDPLDFLRYTEDYGFKKHYGCASHLHIVGFIITPQTISARVMLMGDQRTLWEMPADLDETSEVTLFPSEMLRNSKIDLPGFDVPDTEPDYRPSRFVFNMLKCPRYGYINPFYLSSELRSCHIALGKSDGATPRNVDYDVPFAVRNERIMIESDNDNIETHDLGKCVVRRIGNYWFVYPKEGIDFVALFATCCTPTNN